MSYNRGLYLENCVQSIRDNFSFPLDLVVFDDHSTDIDTNNTLDSLASSVQVIKTSRMGYSTKHKGLYINMNSALRLAISNNYGLLFVIQDDLQVIRKVDETELKRIAKIFHDPSIAVVVPLFFKMNHKKDYTSLILFNKDLDFYYPASNNQRYLSGIADVGVFDVQKLKALSWTFKESETKNIDDGKQLGLKRAVMKNPFLAYLPWPKTYRNKISNFNDAVTFITDYYYNAGFHPFEYIKPESLTKLLNRPAHLIPFAEDYLVLKGKPRLSRPWNYYESSFPIRKAINTLVKLFK